ncbi:hypothetical protein SNEBB_008279, partial [Seison nebaliae]
NVTVDRHQDLNIPTNIIRTTSGRMIGR